MDPELRAVISRYVTVGVVIAGAGFWTVFFAQDVEHKNGAPHVIANGAAPAAFATPPPKTEKAPAVADMIAVRNGKERVLCAPACRLERYCGLRDVDDCLAKSCDGDVRKDNASDLAFARADDCGTASVAPCEEACARRSTCKNNPADADRCTQACKTQTRIKPAELYRESRCVLEAASCEAQAACGSLE